MILKMKYNLIHTLPLMLFTTVFITLLSIATTAYAHTIGSHLHSSKNFTSPESKVEVLKFRFYRPPPDTTNLLANSHIADAQTFSNTSSEKKLDPMDIDSKLPIPDALLIEFVQKKIYEQIGNNQIDITLVDDVHRSSGKRSLIFHYYVQKKHILHYEAKAHRLPNESIIIVGSFPKTEYDPDHFQKHPVSHYTSPQIQDMIYNDFINNNVSIEKEHIRIIETRECSLPSMGYLIPARCVSFSAKKTFWQATITHHGLNSVSASRHSYCGIIRGVEKYNQSDGTQAYSVDLCNANPKKDRLENERFLFDHQTTNSGSNCALSRKAMDDIKKIEEKSNQSASDLLILSPSYTFSASAISFAAPDDTLIHSEDKGISVFSYSDLGTLGYKKIHSFSHLNRMMNWFESRGFDQHNTSLPIHILFSQDSEHEGNAFYTMLSLTQAGKQTRYHRIVFGEDGLFKDIALDFDIAAHELGHYVIGFGLTPSNMIRDNRNHTGAIHEGLADYFVYAATEDDCLAEKICKTSSYCRHRNGKCLRIAETKRIRYENSHYQNVLSQGDKKHTNIHEIGRLVSGTLWRVRKDLTSEDQKYFDQMILESLDYIPTSHHVTFSDWIDAIVLASMSNTRSQKFCHAVIKSAEHYEINVYDRSKQHCTDASRYTSPLHSELAATDSDTGNPSLDDNPLSYTVFHEHALHCGSTARNNLTGIELAQYNAQLTINTDRKQPWKNMGCQQIFAANTSSSTLAFSKPVSAIWLEYFIWWMMMLSPILLIMAGNVIISRIGTRLT